MSVPIRRLVVVAALALLMWAAVLYATGGVRFTILDFRVTSRDPVRPFALAVLLLAVGSVVFGHRHIDDECEHVAARCRAAVTPIAIAASLAVTIAGLHWGTFAASGVDAYGYVSQAALWERGTVRVEQPFVAKVPWSDADWAFAPMGYRPAVSGHAMVPSYAPGLSLLMALAGRIAGDCGPYSVVPVLGGLCVWFCYLLGRRAASPIVGASAAALLACSPPFLFQLMVPMSDVPAAAFWTAALYLALREGNGAAAVAGVCAALAVIPAANTPHSAGKARRSTLRGRPRTCASGMSSAFDAKDAARFETPRRGGRATPRGVSARSRTSGTRVRFAVMRSAVAAVSPSRATCRLPTAFPARRPPRSPELPA